MLQELIDLSKNDSSKILPYYYHHLCGDIIGDPVATVLTSLDEANNIVDNHYACDIHASINHCFSINAKTGKSEQATIVEQQTILALSVQSYEDDPEVYGIFSGYQQLYLYNILPGQEASIQTILNHLCQNDATFTEQLYVVDIDFPESCYWSYMLRHKAFDSEFDKCDREYIGFNNDYIKNYEFAAPTTDISSLDDDAGYIIISLNHENPFYYIDRMSLVAADTRLIYFAVNTFSYCSKFRNEFVKYLQMTFYI